MNREKALEELNKLFEKNMQDQIILGWEPWRRFPWKIVKGPFVAFGETPEKATEAVNQDPYREEERFTS